MKSEKLVFSREDLSRMLKECIKDLKDSGVKMIDLSHFLRCLGETKNEKIFLAIFPAIGSFASEILRFRQLTLLPMIPANIKSRITANLESAIKGGQEALQELHKVLCEEDDINYEKLIDILAKLHQHDFALAAEWSRITRSRGRGERAGAE